MNKPNCCEKCAATEGEYKGLCIFSHCPCHTAPMNKETTPEREDGSQKGWGLHKPTCLVWVCNPRKIHEDGICDCECGCGLSNFIATATAEARERENARIAKLLASWLKEEGLREKIEGFCIGVLERHSNGE